LGRRENTPPIILPFNGAVIFATWIAGELANDVEEEVGEEG